MNAAESHAVLALDLRKCRERGNTLQQAAVRLGVPASIASRCARDAGIVFRDSRIPLSSNSVRILELVVAGVETSARIATLSGINIPAVCQALGRLERAGLVRRAGSIASGNPCRPFTRWKAAK